MMRVLSHARKGYGPDCTRKSGQTLDEAGDGGAVCGALLAATKLGHPVFGHPVFAHPTKTRFNARCPHTTTLNLDVREQAIQSAIRDFEPGVYSSQRAAAAAWGVPRSSLRARLTGRLPHAIAHQISSD